MVRVEKEKEVMQNSILFQTVKISDEEFGSQASKKLKNKENSIRAEGFSFEKVKISLMKNSSSEQKKKKR